MKRTEDLVLKVNILSSICYLCKQCCGLFYHKDALNRHLLKCKKEIDRFTSWPENVYSKVISEENSDNYNPLSCDFKSTKLRSLQTQEGTPSKLKPFACPVCKESFSEVEYLYEHRIIHSGPFICRSCGKSFTRAWSLRRHLSSHFRDAHTSCKVCQKRFTRKDNLRKHCKKHFNDFEYICGVCGEKHERKMCYNKNSSKLTISKTPANKIDNSRVLQDRTLPEGRFLSSAAKSRLNKELKSLGNPVTSLEEASLLNKSPLLKSESLKMTSSKEISNDAEPMYLTKSKPDSSSGDTLSERSSLSCGIVNLQSCWEDISLESFTDEITDSVDFMEVISSEEVSSLLNVTFSEYFQEGTLHVSPFQSKIAQPNTSLESVTFKESSSLDEINNAQNWSEWSLVEEPSFSTGIKSPKPQLEGVSSEGSPLSENLNKEASLENESQVRARYSIRNGTSRAILDASELETPLSPSGLVNSQALLIDVPARGISVSGNKTNPNGLLPEGFSSPHETTNPCNSKECELQEIPCRESQDCETMDIQSPIFDIENATDFIEKALLESPFSIEDPNFWTLLEDNFLEGPPMSETNLHTNSWEETLFEAASSLREISDSRVQDQRTSDKITSIPRKAESIISLETSSEKSPPSYEFTSKRVFQKRPTGSKSCLDRDRITSSSFSGPTVSQVYGV